MNHSLSARARRLLPFSLLLILLYSFYRYFISQTQTTREWEFRTFEPPRHMMNDEFEVDQIAGRIVVERG